MFIFVISTLLLLISKSQLNKSTKLDSFIQMDISPSDKGKERSILRFLSSADVFKEDAKLLEKFDLEIIS